MDKKINGIDLIVWINMNRSTDRYMRMMNILSVLSVKSMRIEAIDGREHKYNEKINDAEMACLCSHIKAIYEVSKMEGQYFLILEDDIALDNIFLIDNDLKTIIEKCPSFGILMLEKKTTIHIHNDYAAWKNGIFSTAAYVISRKGIDDVLKYVNMESYTFNIPIDVADRFIYNCTKTFYYKYNFINTLDIDSTIHDNQLSGHKICSHNQFLFILENSSKIINIPKDVHIVKDIEKSYIFEKLLIYCDNYDRNSIMHFINNNYGINKIILFVKKNILHIEEKHNILFVCDDVKIFNLLCMMYDNVYLDKQNFR